MFHASALLFACASIAALVVSGSSTILRENRSSPGDLEVGGELAGLPPGSTRYVRYQDLLQLPQESFTVSDDTNFPAKTVIGGVPLSTVARLFGQAPDSDLIVAICYDRYRANYPRDYLAAHHPLLVLRIDGKLRDQWPLSEHNGPLGPYLISHPVFTPAFKVLSHADEPQIPFGVTRIELRRESTVFSAIRPPGDWPSGSAVEQGYRIARQDCFRCHNMDAEGGMMAGHSWLQLARIAASDSPRFQQIIRNPAAVTPGAQMAPHPGYDDATLAALTAYFKTFSAAGSKP